MRTDPLMTSLPLITMSYASDSAAPLSSAKFSRHSGVGEVKGWCMKVQEPSSVSSNIGKSTTNRNDQLPGCAEVLVPEAARDLVVPLEPADHQQLLEQLGRLRKRVPLARLQPDGDDEVAGPLRRGARQVRRLDL